MFFWHPNGKENLEKPQTADVVRSYLDESSLLDRGQELEIIGKKSQIGKTDQSSKNWEQYYLEKDGMLYVRSNGQEFSWEPFVKLRWGEKK